jgi:hypothetical protein
MSMVLACSQMVLFALSATPFCSGLYSPVSWWLIPFLLKKFKSCVHILSSIIGSQCFQRLPRWFSVNALNGSNFDKHINTTRKYTSFTCFRLWCKEVAVSSAGCHIRGSANTFEYTSSSTCSAHIYSVIYVCFVCVRFRQCPLCGPSPWKSTPAASFCLSNVKVPYSRCPILLCHRFSAFLLVNANAAPLFWAWFNV